MDEEEPTRVRIMISAQRDKTGAYAGQIFVDMGGNQLMLENDVRRGREGMLPRAQLVRARPANGCSSISVITSAISRSIFSAVWLPATRT
jgi:hypothetical protein